MADPANETVLQKAKLVQVLPDFLNEDQSAKDKAVVVQFNPETLKVSYANQIQQPDPGDKRGSQGILFVGAGTTKMTCTLWFDVTSPQPPQQDPAWKDVDDVRKLTNRVSYFITPAPNPKDEKKFIPPPVRFEWGSFRFAGILESVEESLEFFSPEGRPLRASVAIGISQQKIMVFPVEDAKGAPKRTPGTRPTTPVPQGSSVQKLAGPNWQGVASLNGIENPRLPAVGIRLDLGLSKE